MRGVNKYPSLTPTPTLELQHSWSWPGISHVSLTWQGRISLTNDQCLVKPMQWMDKNLQISKRDMSLPIAHTMQPPNRNLFWSIEKISAAFHHSDLPRGLFCLITKGRGSYDSGISPSLLSMICFSEHRRGFPLTLTSMNTNLDQDLGKA